MDSPVQGITYQSGSGTPGVTNANGGFSYTRGEPITFSVGGVVIGTLPDGAPLVTPFEFGTAAALNIARFLQTLDEDGDPANGIDVRAAAAALAGTVVDASVFAADTATFEMQMQASLDLALGAGAMLIDEATAIAHLTSEIIQPFDLGSMAPASHHVAVFEQADRFAVMLFDIRPAPGGLEGETEGAVDIIWNEDTTDSGGSGETTPYAWSIDSSGAMQVSNPDTSVAFTMRRTGGSPDAPRVILSEPGKPSILGVLANPIPATDFSAAGASGRTYDAAFDAGNGLVNRMTLYPDGSLLRIENNVEFDENWEVTPSRFTANILINRLLNGGNLSLLDGTDAFRMLAMTTGSVANGGTTIVLEARDVDNDPNLMDLRFDAMQVGTLTPVIATNPDNTIPYELLTNTNRVTDCQLCDVPECSLTDTLGEAFVRGTFDYDPSAVIDNSDDARDFVGDVTVFAGDAFYRGSFQNFEVELAGFTISENTNVTAVANDGLILFGWNSVVDSILAMLRPPPIRIDSFTVELVQMTWREGPRSSGVETESDFLHSADLPELLPGFPGRMRFIYDSDLSACDSIEGPLTYGFRRLEVSPRTTNPPR